MMEMKKYFSDLVDSRDNRGLRHTLVDIVVINTKIITFPL